MRSAMRAASQLPLMWMMPLHLHVNQKSDYDDDDSNVYCLYRYQYISKRVHVPKCKHFPTTGYARVLLFMFIRRELAEERYRMFISVYILL